MNKASKIRSLLAALALPLLVGGAAALLSGDGFPIYKTLYRPLFSPPGWVFPVVWTALYLLMGLASWLVYTSQASPPRKIRALKVYAAQLALNFLWPLLFFGWGMYLAALLELLVLLGAVWVCWLLFRHISEKAGTLLLPYLAWLLFAVYLNLGIVLLN